MKLVINKDRSVIPVGTWGTKNENDYEILEFEFPEELENYNKRIVYYLDDTKPWDAIVDNKAYITNAITSKENVKAYIWCTKENSERPADTDFRSQEFEMHFYENENADGIVPTPVQVDGFNTMLTAMNAKIDEVDALEQTIETAEAERQENENTRISNESTRESNESTRQTNEETRQTQEADRERRTDEAISNIQDKTAEYNANAEAKTNAFNQNATQKTNDFNSNYTQKVNDFNTNATTQKTDFNSNASSKTSAFNSNAETKTNAFNTNAESKTTEFNTNATSKTNDFNDNATEKTTAYNTNAQNKIDEYDEHIVEYQAQIDELQEEVEELSENMPWNTTEQATEISVDDAAKYSKNKLELFGNTSQASTSIASGDEYDSPSTEHPQPIHVVTGNNTIRLLKPGESVIPSNYTQLDYIESTGTQYIDTGYIPLDTDTISIEVYPIDYNSFFGATNFATARADKDDDYFRIFENGGILSGKLTLKKWQTGIYNGTTKIFKMHNNSIYAGNKAATSNLWLFGRSDSKNLGKSRIKSFKVEGKFNLIPCYRNSDNEIGMYDLINDAFYINDGAGDFVAGNEFLPPTYPVNLGNIELYKIGDYQDFIFKNTTDSEYYDDSLVQNCWYIKKNLKKRFITENDKIKLTTTNNKKFFYIVESNMKIVGNNNQQKNFMYCNRLSNDYSANSIHVHTDLINKIAANNAREFIISLNDDDFPDVATFKNYIRDNPLYVIYIAETSDNILTDETLISQLDEIYENLKLVKGTNNITVTAEDLAPYMKLTYMQDLPSKLDNLDSRLSLLE